MYWWYSYWVQRSLLVQYLFHCTVWLIEQINESRLVAICTDAAGTECKELYDYTVNCCTAHFYRQTSLSKPPSLCLTHLYMYWLFLICANRILLDRFFVVLAHIFQIFCMWSSIPSGNIASVLYPLHCSSFCDKTKIPLITGFYSKRLNKFGHKKWKDLRTI